jgi:tRNA(fMet)-specific endonuclease VapC
VRYLLDTDTCIWLLRRREQVVERVRSESPDDLALASMTLAELYFGALRSSDPESAGAGIELLLRAPIQVIPFDQGAAAEHASIRLALLATPIGERDLVIASTAAANQLTIVTGNTREFRRVPGLSVESWN